MNRSIKQRVKAGAAWLDQTFGRSWPRRVKLTTLDLSSGCQCVLGQLDGDFGDSVQARGLGTWRAAIPLGFVEGHGEARYLALTEAWKDEIRVRRGTR